MPPIDFVLPHALPSLNQELRTHWAKRSRQKHALALEVMAAIGGPAHFPAVPFERASITITRHGTKLLDYDGLVGSMKPLIDVLCVKSKTHPAGLGIITDDRPDVLTVEYLQARTTRGASVTVRIERLGGEV